MKLRSNRVFNRGKPKINSHIKKQGFYSERRLSLRSNKLNHGKTGANEGEIGSCVDCDENIEMGMKEGLNSDDKGLFLGSEVLDPMEDLVVSCSKEEINLSETGLDFEEDIKSPHVECANGDKSLESETLAEDMMIVYGDDDKRTSLNDLRDSNLLGKCEEMKVKGRRGGKKKNVGNLTKNGSDQKKIDVVTGVSGGDDECTLTPLTVNESDQKEILVVTSVNGDDVECTTLKPLKCKRGRKKKNVGNLKKKESNQKQVDVVTSVNVTSVNGDECTLTPLKRKRGRKRKKVEALGSEYNGRVESEKVEEGGVRVAERAVSVDGGFRAVVLGFTRADDVLPNVVTRVENTDDTLPNVVTRVENTIDVLPNVVTRVENKIDVLPNVVTTVENMIPKKKLKRRSRRKFSSSGAFQTDDGGFRVVVLGLRRSGDIPNNNPTTTKPVKIPHTIKKKLKRCGRSAEVLIEGKNVRPKKKLKRREIKLLPSNEIPIKKVERRGRPRKVLHEIQKVEHRGRPRKVLHEIQKVERRGRPRKISHEIPAGQKLYGKTRTVKLVSVKKQSKFCKNEKSEENSERTMVVGEFLKAGKEIIGGKLYRQQLKQSIRDKISNLLLKCGWTIDFKQRQEKTYMDAVYIEPNGRRSPHYSVTKAYAKLKKKIENGGADDNERSAFTPIPEEEISILFRQRRSKKTKNKILKNVKKGKRGRKKKKDGKESKHGSKRKMIFKPRFENALKQGNEGVLVIKRRNLLTWMIDLGIILAGTKVQYGKTRRQKRSYEGVITSDGICCGCCNETMGMTKFVGHCGGKFGRVFDDLYLESGVCVRKCLMDSWRKEEESDVNSFNDVDVRGDDPNDDTCNICGDGGDLICCDGCPSTFHQSCLDVEDFPSGDSNCIYCTCKFCGVVSVSIPEAEDSHDEVKPQMLSCCLCEEKFHQSCLQEVEDVNQDSNGQTFCGRKCQELFERLQTHLGVKHELEDGFSWTLLQRSGVDQDLNVLDTQLRVEHNSKLAVAFSVMDECFVPIVDERSGTSIIRNVVYNCGSNFKRLNYVGFLTAVLEKDDEFITAASIRIHGYRFAEMPFIGTRHIYRRQGMCRRLLDAIESTLSSIGVEELIIPAIPALLQTWMDVFGFMPLDDTKKQAMKCMNMMVFPGIDMLKKPLLQFQSADVDHTPSAGVVKNVIDHEQKEETVLLIEGCSSPTPNDENTPQVEPASSNATDYKSADTASFGKDIIDYEQTENDKLICDLNLPVPNVLPCDIDGQTFANSESVPDCAIGPVVCGNPVMSELKLDVEDDGVSGVKVKSSPLTSTRVLKNTFDLNLQPAAVETDVHIKYDDFVQFDQSAAGQTDSKTCESQPLVIR